MIKQLHKQHYQLHLLLTSLTSFLSYIYELTEVYILFQMFCLTSPFWWSVLSLVMLLTLDFLILVFLWLFVTHICYDKKSQETL